MSRQSSRNLNLVEFGGHKNKFKKSTDVHNYTLYRNKQKSLLKLSCLTLKFLLFNTHTHTHMYI